jgi:hypothetical protein
MRLVSLGIVPSPCKSSLLPGRHRRALLEALWKQESENRGAGLRKAEWELGGSKSTKYLKTQNKRKFCAMLRTPSGYTHNLKVTGSNPVPATNHLPSLQQPLA